jgi:hypothetical protein
LPAHSADAIGSPWRPKPAENQTAETILCFIWFFRLIRPRSILAFHRTAAEDARGASLCMSKIHMTDYNNLFHLLFFRPFDLNQPE